MGEVLEFKPVGEDEKNKEIDVRILTPDEVESLRPIFEQQGAVFPNPTTSFAVGAVDVSGKVIAFLFFQLQIHAEPMYIEHPHEALFSRIVSVGEKTLLERVGPCITYAFTPAGKMTKMASVFGYKLEPWNVMSKLLVTPDEEVQ